MGNMWSEVVESFLQHANLLLDRSSQVCANRVLVFYCYGAVFECLGLQDQIPLTDFPGSQELFHDIRSINGDYAYVRVCLH